MHEYTGSSTGGDLLNMSHVDLQTADTDRSEKSLTKNACGII